MKLKFLASFVFAITLGTTSLSAQIDKSVEVTKSYVPSVADAPKMAIEPNMVDTVKLNPEISYVIEPLEFQNNFDTHNIAPAKVTYWEFNRPKPLFIRLGAGYPYNVISDLYYATQNKDVGYFAASITGRVRNSKLTNDFDQESKAKYSFSNFRVGAGKYLGTRTLDGEINYSNLGATRYGVRQPISHTFGDLSYNDIDLKVGIGDDFLDLSHFNFRVEAFGDVFLSRNEMADGNPHKDTNFEYGVSGALARSFDIHTISFNAGYQGVGYGKNTAAGYKNFLSSELLYNRDGMVLDLTVGAKLYYQSGSDTYLGSTTYILPVAKLLFDFGKPGLKPYITLDGEAVDNSIDRVMFDSPYLSPSIRNLSIGRVDGFRSNFKVGFTGGSKNGSFTYDLWGGYTDLQNIACDAIIGNDLVLGTYSMESIAMGGEMNIAFSKRLNFNADAIYYFFSANNNPVHPLPKFQLRGALTYNAPKFSFGINAKVRSQATFLAIVLDSATDTTTPNQISSNIENGVYTIPTTIDLGAAASWKLSKSWSIFTNLNNILNQELYPHPLYRGYGITITAGVATQF